MIPKKYLRITLHDNDFTSYYQILGETLLKVFQSEKTYPTEEDLSEMETFVSHLWYSIHNIKSLMRWKDTPIPYKESSMDCFYPDISIVDDSDIPDSENFEAIYVPMFDGDNRVLLK